MSYDFSEFHDLMHPWFTAECRAQAGGWRRHLALWWTYKMRDRIERYPRKLLCRMGRHQLIAYWKPGVPLSEWHTLENDPPPDGYQCYWCAHNEQLW